MMAKHDARDLGTEKRIDDGRSDYRVLAENAQVVRREIAFAIEAVIVEQTHSAVVHQCDNARRIDLALRYRQEARERVDASHHGVGVPAQLGKAREIGLDHLLRDA